MGNTSGWKKKLRSIAAAGMAVLFLVLIFLSGRTSPENPMETKDSDASHMYLTSSTLAMDQEKLAGVENANIHTGDTENSVSEQEQKQEEETDSESQNQEQPSDREPEQTDQSQTRQTPDNSRLNQFLSGSSTIDDSLMSLIHKSQTSENPGNQAGDSGNSGNQGTGGGSQPGGSSGQVPSDGGNQTTLDPNASAELFTTDIKDGEVVQTPEYPFHITLTEKGKQLTLVSMTVALNGTGRSCKASDSLTLQEGIANKVTVTLRFRDKKYNQIDAPSKSYTLYYLPDNAVLLEVYNASTGELLGNGSTVETYDGTYPIRISAKRSRSGRIEDITSDAIVRLNNKKLSGSGGGRYDLALTVGNKNTLKVTAGQAGANQQVFQCTLHYKVDHFVLTFESPAFSETISDNYTQAERKFGGRSRKEYSSQSNEFRFRVRCSVETGLEEITSILMTNRYGTNEMKSQAGADGYITINLDSSQSTYIKVTCTDAEGQTKWYTWELVYKREQNPNGGDSFHAPVIELFSAETFTSSNPYNLGVRAKDYSGNELSIDNIKVYINGVEHEIDSTLHYYWYNLVLTEGLNDVRVVVTDNEQYTAEKNFTLTYSPTGDKDDDGKDQELQIHFVLKANNVGLGTLIDENIKVKPGTRLGEMVEERLAAYGYQTEYSGSPASGDYFLNQIIRPGLLDNWSITDDLRKFVEMEGLIIKEQPDSLNKLGNNSFVDGTSGWVVLKNHVWVGNSMGVIGLASGDLIEMSYTLDNGNDQSLQPSE